MTNLRKGDKSQMKLKSRIFRSTNPVSGKYASRFEDPEKIQDHLQSICVAWRKYLHAYVNRSTELFGTPESPWSYTERPVVGTLAASISRNFPDSIVLEEFPVRKPGSKSNSSATKSTDRGRCDLWATIRDKTGEFNFYLEAKMSPHPRETRKLQVQLQGWYGISKIFRDYMKSHPKTLIQGSQYRKSRKHSHYIIGMLVTRLDRAANNLTEIEDILRETFEESQVLLIRRSTAKTDEIKNQRRMARYPTVALTMIDPAGLNSGFVASFTVLGATSDFHKRGITRQASVSDPA